MIIFNKLQKLSNQLFRSLKKHFERKIFWLQIKFMELNNIECGKEKFYTFNYLAFLLVVMSLLFSWVAKMEIVF